MSILNKIIHDKKLAIEAARRKLPVNQLIHFPFYAKPVNSLKNSLLNGNGIIAEYKRKSPSAGNITSQDIAKVLQGYDQMNVSAFSILTDQKYFGGKMEDLEFAASSFSKPILRKDFIIDEYQLFESKAFGADAVLLIASVLDAYHAKYLCQMAQSIGLEVLMEFHSVQELKILPSEVDVIGINNRNLETMTTDITNSENLLKHLPYNKVKISESGVKDYVTYKRLLANGFDGCLIGEGLLNGPEFRKDLMALELCKKAIV